MNVTERIMLASHPRRARQPREQSSINQLTLATRVMDEFPRGSYLTCQPWGLHKLREYPAGPRDHPSATY